MKFEIHTDSLRNAVSTAVRFTEKKANLPVLGSILLSAEGGRLLLRATNLECGVEISTAAKITEDGIVAVPAAVLSGFLSNARGKIVKANLVGDVLKLEAEHTSASIRTLPHEDFPVLPRVSAEQSFLVKSQDLTKLIRSVAYCASVSSIKPELQSVMVFGEAGKLYAVATDSFRLAEKSVPLRSKGSVPQLLVPARNAAELMRIVDSVSGDVELYYSEHQLSVQTDGVYYTSRLLDGTFPNYKQIIPKTFATEVVVLREEMGTALKSLSVFADKFAQITVGIEPAQKALVLTSRNPDVGEQINTLQATISGEGASMSFNGRYLADSLQAVVGDSVRIHSNGSGKAILIKDASDDSFFYLVMPMNR